MKLIKGVLLAGIMLLAGCGDQTVGPSGPQGPEGPAGPVGSAFEAEVNFTNSNDYMRIVEIPSNIEVLDSDIIAVYWLFEQDAETGNDVWQPLPATVFFDDGQFQYAFDHTLADVRLFLNGNIDFSTVGNDYRRNQVFRIAVLPVDYVNANNIDMKNVAQVMGAVKDTRHIKRIKQ